MRASRSFALAYLCAFAAAGLMESGSAVAAAGHPGGSTRHNTNLVAIRATVNGSAVTLRTDGTLAPSSVYVGTSEQFELRHFGKGIVALRSAANGKFISAHGLGPLAADADAIGFDQLFHAAGGSTTRVRLRAVVSKRFVCATDGGAGVMAVTKHCPPRWQLLEFEQLRTEPSSFTITQPAPGSALTTRTVTFQWEAGGDEYWLDVGSVPGGSDVYRSESLGAVQEHAVTLPLNGQALYVRVSRRIGTAIESTDATYTAAFRKGLAVIADFADRRLEDWTESGFRTVDELRAQLDEMERHWAWLSRDSERLRWDIIRVQLPQPAVADAYPDWVTFREAVVALALEQVRVADYDVHGDGVVDTAWLVVSSGREPVPFAIGGTSSSGGACVFVDGQASDSVRAGATGNFTHETGHCLGLPDMYGPYSTLNKLTVMNDSWALPPQDFSAFDRVTLEWADPQIVAATTAGVWLPSANDVLAVVKIPTIRPEEYFLLEYRNPPATGYGSATQGYKGLAVYHVLAGSSMSQDPPLVKLEPADQLIAPHEPFDPDDFLSPDTPAMFLPFVGRSYYDDRDEIFRIGNLRWRDGGLAFDVTIVPQPPPTAGSNLLLNESFETGQAGLPDAWSPGWYVPQDASFVWPEPTAMDGASSASLQAAIGNDIRWWQSVETTPGERYQLCGYLKGEDIRPVQGDVGGNVSVIGGFVRSESLSGTFDWTRACVAFSAESSRTEVACRLGFYGSTAVGKLSCDSLRLEHIRLHSAFER